jgi:hypothetical protein
VEQRLSAQKPQVSNPEVLKPQVRHRASDFHQQIEVMTVTGAGGERVLDCNDRPAVVLDHEAFAERAEQHNVGNQATAGRRECRL